MKIYHLLALFFLIAVGPLQAQNSKLSDVLAKEYCKELTEIDTATRSNFEHILPVLDEKIIFCDSGFLPSVVDVVNERNISYKDFYAEVYNKFSSQCPAYQVLYGLDTTIQLKDPAFFTNSFCDCFNEQTGGTIANEDLTSVLKTCNEKLGDNRKYKRKLRKELKNKELSAQEFSAYITARFLTDCDLIVNHFFNRQAKFLERNTEIMLGKKESEK